MLPSAPPPDRTRRSALEAKWPKLNRGDHTLPGCGSNKIWRPQPCPCFEDWSGRPNHFAKLTRVLLYTRTGAGFQIKHHFSQEMDCIHARHRSLITFKFLSTQQRMSLISRQTRVLSPDQTSGQNHRCAVCLDTLNSVVVSIQSYLLRYKCRTGRR